MPRAPFNLIATFVEGPAQPGAGTVRVSGPARFVRADGITQVGPGAPNIVGWVTVEDGQPVGSWTDGEIGVDARLADQVGFDGGPLAYWVVYVERVVWAGADYFRASIAELPFPDGCGCSENVCGPRSCLTADPIGPGDVSPMLLPMGWYVYTSSGSSVVTFHADAGVFDVWESCGGSYLGSGGDVSLPMGPGDMVYVDATETLTGFSVLA